MIHRRCDKLIKHMEEELALVYTQLLAVQERNDRLMEALAQKSGIDLVLPVAPRPLEPAPEPLVPAAKVDYWWRANVSGHSIATPPKEEKVSAP